MKKIQSKKKAHPK